MTSSPAPDDPTISITSPSARDWDQFVRRQPRAHLLQLSGWGELKSQFGWDSQIVALSRAGRIAAGALVLLKALPLRLGRMAYAPMGGYAADESLYPPLWDAIKTQTGAAFLKLEPGIFINSPPPDFASMGFHASPQTVQPPNTICLDIRGSDSDIMARMNQGTRRKIRKSLKSGIVYNIGTRRDLPDFNRLMRQTSERNAFDVHSAAYYEEVYDRFIPEYGALLTAKHAGRPLAAIMVFALRDAAWYIYGASSREKSNLYATYGIQWQAIQWAKAQGCVWYDLWGIPDCDEATLEAQFRGRSDGLWGVYGFKRGWGGDVRRSVGAWDKAFHPPVYAAYRAALKLRR